MLTFYLIAVVMAVSGDRLTIDKGMIDGLRVGDEGRVCYVLKVNDEEKLIQRATCEIVEVDDFTAVAAMREYHPVRTRFMVRFALPGDRTSPASLLSLGKRRMEEGKLDLALTYFDRIKRAIPDDPLVETMIREVEKRKQDAFRLREVQKAAAQEEERRKTMILIRGASFEIGLNVKEAKFFNQTPRFAAQIKSFWIDRAPADQVGFTFEQAEKHCRQNGKRLPTEFELEVGSRQPGFLMSANAEWTQSWYLQYPGNQRKEDDYGEKYRVIRGPVDMRLRSFLLPGEKSPDTSFRCACDASEAKDLLAQGEQKQ